MTFLMECKKLKAEKELLEEATDKKASAAVLVMDEEQDLEGYEESDVEKDDNQNLVFNIPTANKFDILAKPPLTAGLPSSPATFCQCHQHRDLHHHQPQRDGQHYPLCPPELHHFQTRSSF